ncbi:MAG: replication-associated recombination protein A [Chloroflexota bacterium]
MDELFESPEPAPVIRKTETNAPLAVRMRPRSQREVVGQEKLLSEGAPLRAFFETKNFPSMIFWGPPGSGKTTLALLIAESSGSRFITLSAVDSGVKELREVIAQAGKSSVYGKRTILFIDEIHRFNKAQQDALLHAVERGVITLIGATTENPSFEVNSALLSRCQVYRLRSLSDDDVRRVIERAIKEDETLSKYKLKLDEDARDFLLKIAAGDARTALNALELAFKLLRARPDEEATITRELLGRALQQKTAQYDKKGETHYDTISAFIKSLRGSDPDAAVFWMAKMLESGEDPRFIARRMVIFASEDVGNAEPQALQIAVAVFQAVQMIGMPEAAINLGQAATFLASCPKSNASYRAIMDAMEDVRNGASLEVPMHLRNAPTRLMKDEGYSAGYQYPHSHEGHFVAENYFPPGSKPKKYYKPGEFGKEKEFRERLSRLWSSRDEEAKG